MADGWKYFDLLNLNELFHIKFLEKQEEGAIEEIEDIDPEQFVSSQSQGRLS